MSELFIKNIEIKSFDIKGSLLSGQSFRWNYYQNSEQKYFGVINDDLFILEKKKDDWYSVTTTKKFSRDKEFHEFISRYFSLDIASEDLFPTGFSVRYPDIRRLIKPYMGIKVLRQSAFETLITFMCAQGLGMNIIRRQITYLTREYGKEQTVDIDGNPFTYYSFPSPETLAGIAPDSLRLCTNNNCIRATNIIKAAHSVATGQLDLESPERPQNALRSGQRETFCQFGNRQQDCRLCPVVRPAPFFGIPHRHTRAPVSGCMVFNRQGTTIIDPKELSFPSERGFTHSEP